MHAEAQRAAEAPAWLPCPPANRRLSVHAPLCAGTLDAELAQRAVEYRGLAARLDVARAAVKPLPKWEKRASLLLRRLAEKEVRPAGLEACAGRSGELAGVVQQQCCLHHLPAHRSGLHAFGTHSTPHLCPTPPTTGRGC